MMDYRTMYFKLAAKVADALDILLKAQQEGETQFMNEEQPVSGLKEDSLRRISLLRRDSEEPEKNE